MNLFVPASASMPAASSHAEMEGRITAAKKAALQAKGAGNKELAIAKLREAKALEASPKESTRRAAAEDVQMLKDDIEALEKREEHAMRKIDAEVTSAKSLAQEGKKHEALQCIKRKKMFEKQLEAMASTKLTLENQQIALELERVNIAPLAASTCRAVPCAMARQSKALGGVESVDKTMDAQRLKDDIESNALSGCLNMTQGRRPTFIESRFCTRVEYRSAP